MKNQRHFDWHAARERLRELRNRPQRQAEFSQERERVFRRRAELLARPARHAGILEDGDPIMVFRLDAERYAMPLGRVSEVISGAVIAFVPGAPPTIAGVIQVRGEVRPVFDLAQMLRAAESASEGMNSVIMMRHNTREVGFRVHAVEDIRTIPSHERRPAPAGVAHAEWMTPDLVTVLNLQSLLEGGA